MRWNIPVEYKMFNVHNVLKVVYIHIALNVTTREKHNMTIVTNVVKAALMFISSGVLALSYFKVMQQMGTSDLEQQKNITDVSPAMKGNT